MPRILSPLTTREFLLATAFLALYLLLDWASYIRPLHGLNITPWNPQPALAVALLIARPRWIGLVACVLAGAEQVVREVPADWPATLGVAIGLTLTYLVIAKMLTRQLAKATASLRRQDLLQFTAIVLIGSLACALIYVAAFFASGRWPAQDFPQALWRYWVGDAVGLVVMLPLIFVLQNRIRRTALIAVLRNRESLLIGLLMLGLLVGIFSQADRDHVKFSYLLLLPVIWGAARLGASGAVLVSAVTQIGLIVGIIGSSNADLTVYELQVLMVTLTMTGLFLGVTVDERERALVELRHSLGLAAAGQMSAALAHELGQPLTALSTYAQAARALCTDGSLADPLRFEQMVDITGRIVSESRRATEVVKRLREFFLAGTTRLQHVRPADLVADAVAAQSARAQAQQVDLQVIIAPHLPAVMVDPVQIGVVLRNLMANALDATAGLEGERKVSAQAGLVGHEVRITIEDTGHGVDATAVDAIFESGRSAKPGSMGVGLSICRAIIEAHGGRLCVEPGKRGHFWFSLPLESADIPRLHHAS